MRGQITAFESLCAELWPSRPPRSRSRGCCTSRRATAPITGPRTLEQFDSALRASQLKLDDKALTRLDEIFPGPGGPAPEAYAW